MPVDHQRSDQHAPEFVEWRAKVIRDPVRRLRYLRRTARLETVQSRAMAPPPARSGIRARWPVAAFLLLLFLPVRHTSDASPPASPPVETSVKEAATKPSLDDLSPPPQSAEPAEVWIVEKADEFETYSNGLRVENLYAVAGRPRLFAPLPRRAEAPAPPPRSEAAGIVFHSTESHQLPFAERRNRALKRVGRDLLEFVRANRSYHFLIDRFGRVHRIVREKDEANHAGHSVWADDDWIYVNLNDSFLGVAFEARGGRGVPEVTAAQVQACRNLTEMLRARYGIAPGNCVTHAQVSVNPGNFRAGYHTDWASGFPFEAVGLPPSYESPLPSILLFGFGYDVAANAGEPGVGLGVKAAEQRLAKEAAERGVPESLHRAALQRQYREAVAAAARRPVRLAAAVRPVPFPGEIQ
jgi:hypothetical protein